MLLNEDTKSCKILFKILLHYSTVKIRTGNESLKNDLNFRIKTETVMVGANAMIYTLYSKSLVSGTDI